MTPDGKPDDVAGGRLTDAQQSIRRRRVLTIIAICTPPRGHSVGGEQRRRSAGIGGCADRRISGGIGKGISKGIGMVVP